MLIVSANGARSMNADDLEERRTVEDAMSDITVTTGQ
jgi:hypothetical protein